MEWFQNKLWVRKLYIYYLDIYCSISRTKISEWCSKWQCHCEEINRTHSYMKICWKFLAVLFRVPLSYSKYFISSKTQKEHWLDIVSSCMEPAWRCCEYTQASIVRLLWPNHLLGAPERKPEPREGSFLATETMNITENQVKSSKPWASQPNICALCPQFSILTNKENKRILHNV